jgi:hypothetical protein
MYGSQGNQFPDCADGGDFNVPIKKAVWRGREIIYGDGLAERQFEQAFIKPYWADSKLREPSGLMAE